MKKGKSKSSSNTWRLVSLQLCRFSIPMPEKLRFRREIVPIIQLMALLQSFLEKNESISEIILLSLTIAFSIESFLIALKDTHFLRNTELKAILFYLRNLNNYKAGRRFGLCRSLSIAGLTTCFSLGSRFKPRRRHILRRSWGNRPLRKFSRKLPQGVTSMSFSHNMNVISRLYFCPRNNSIFFNNPQIRNYAPI